MKTHPFDRVSFIGGGRVTRFLLEGWKLAGALPKEVRVCDPDREALRKLEANSPGAQAADLSQVIDCPLIVLAVHPPDLTKVLEEIREGLSTSCTLLSLAPKFSIAKIQSAAGVRQVVRMIPNAPSAIGRGYNPVAYAPEVEAETVESLKPLLAPWGEFPEVPERDLEAYAIVSAMGPTYMWFQWQTLRELAVSFGLPPQVADSALLSTVACSAELLLAHGRNPEEVMDMVPVKPLQPEEAVFRTAYLSRLAALYEKLKVS